MKIFRFVLFMCGITLPLIACSTAVSSTEYYVTPTLSGHLINSKTQQPIVNANVYLTDAYQTNSDNVGNFVLPSMAVYKYKNQHVDHQMMIYQNANIMIEKEGYQRKLINVDGIALPVETFDLKTPISIDMGKVYLNPLAEGEHVYGKVYEYVETMPYCVSDESQKEVDCIPVPEGKTYEEVSPNRPLD